MTRLGMLTLLVAFVLPSPGLAQERSAPRPHSAHSGEAPPPALQEPNPTSWEQAYGPAFVADATPPDRVMEARGERSLSELSVVLDAPPPVTGSPNREAGAGDPPPEGGADMHDSDPAGRVAGEILGGVVGLVGAGLVGVGLTAAVASDCEGDFCGLGAAVVGGFGMLGALTIGVPLGVTVAGNGAGGDGGLGWSVLGGAAGMVVGLSAAVAMITLNDELALPAVLLAVASHFSGAILGYELSSGDGDDREPEASREVSLAPTVAVTRDLDGLVLGVAGTM